MYFLYVFSLLGFIIGVIFSSFYFAPKFDERFRDCISIGDVLGKILGKVETKTACFVMFLNGISIVGAQFIVMGYLCKNFLELSNETSIILTSGIIIFYSTFGGIRSVTMTDVLQFFVLIIAIPLISTMLFTEAKINSYDIKIPFQGMFSDKMKVIDYFALLVFWMIPLHFLCITVVQRYLMVRSINAK